MKSDKMHVVAPVCLKKRKINVQLISTSATNAPACVLFLKAVRGKRMIKWRENFSVNVVTTEKLACKLKTTIYNYYIMNTLY